MLHGIVQLALVALPMHLHIRVSCTQLVVPSGAGITPNTCAFSLVVVYRPEGCIYPFS